MVSDANRTKFMNIQSKLKFLNNGKTIKNRNGEHFEDCPWSDENVCYYDKHLKEAETEARSIIHFYYLVKCKNCGFNNL